MFEKLQKAISNVEALGADFVEARYDGFDIQTIIKENGRITQLATRKRAGIGFNVFYKGATAYAFSADTSPEALDKAAKSALGIAKASSGAVIVKSEIDELAPIKNVRLEPNFKEPAWKLETEDKIDIINRMEVVANEHGENISSLMLLYGELSGEKYFTNSEGTEIYWFPNVMDIRTMVTSKTQEGDLVTASDGYGGSVGLEYFKQEGKTPEDLGKNAALWAKEKMKAKVAPAGEFRALCENSLTGVLAHESFGHLTEADFVVTKGSPIHDKLGERLGSEEATIIDEGVMEQSKNVAPWWLPYDDEGTKTGKTVLLDKGILTGYLHSRTTAKHLGAALTGNARAVNFTFAPIPRMKNTYFTPGDINGEEEALEQLGTGIYAIKTAGGQVGGSGDFLFKAVRGYWVENGEKKYPLKDVSLTGNILELLQNVEGATKDFALYSSYFGGCGKGGQYPLPVGIGGPKIIFSKVRFGGESK